MVIKAGKLRPSQAVTQFGPGALVDLPTLSMILSSTDSWDLANSARIGEKRLAEKLRVSNFRSPPYLHYKFGTGGVPARVFPEYLVCPNCRRLGPLGSFTFVPKGSPKYVCERPHGKRKGYPDVYPARFMVACAKGHLDDFPWRAYVHPGVSCNSDLKLTDNGRTGSITDLWVECPAHGNRKNLGQAMGIKGRESLPPCSGASPWLGPDTSEACSEQVHVLLRGASNAYFPVMESAISVPPWSDPIQIKIDQYVDLMAKLESVDDVEGWRKYNNAPELDEFSSTQIWDALKLRKDPSDEPEDLRIDEWNSFRSTNTYHPKSEFQIRRETVHPDLSEKIDKVVQAVRLREVRALRGFTRIDPVADIGEMIDVQAIEAGMAPIAKSENQDWLPGVELRGEGVFTEISEEALQKWESRKEVEDLGSRYAKAQSDWYTSRGVPGIPTHPVRYLLLHSLSHMIMRRFGLDCGYGPASLRERIYCAVGAQPMAGILIYTASPDSQGSLGGLVEMTRKDMFAQLFKAALEDAHICANDPFCADREPSGSGTQLNGAGCHACLLESETSCEAGNNYLDRAVVVPTLANDKTAFFNS